MASMLSVTVSMGDETSGIFKISFLVTWAVRSTASRLKSEKPGSSSTSSNVKPRAEMIFTSYKKCTKDTRVMQIGFTLALIESSDPKQYINRMRSRDPELAKGWVQIVHTLPIATTGGMQKINCANTEGVFRIIQSIPSHNL